MGLLSGVLAAVMALSSVQDSAKVASNDEKTIMLNAESASKPREINIGFSTSGDGAIVYIDGTKHSYGILKGYWHWPGGNSYQQNGVINLLDAVITTGEIAVVLDSHTKLGGDKLEEPLLSVRLLMALSVWMEIFQDLLPRQKGGTTLWVHLQVTTLLA